MSRLMNWLGRLLEPKAVTIARNKRELQRLCEHFGVSVNISKAIASRYFNEVEK